METSGRAKERARLPEGADRSCRSYLVDLPVVICLSPKSEFDWGGTSVKV